MNRLVKLVNELFHRPRPQGRFVGRMKTRDMNVGANTALKYRMNAGFLGAISRVESAKVEPALMDPTTPATAYGQAVVVNTSANTVRKMQAGDTALDAIYGILVRPYPISQMQASSDMAPASLNTQTPPTSGAVDVLRSGYIMGYVNGAVTKGGRVYVWIAADSGNHKQGSFEASATGGSTIQLDEKSYFNGPADANGVVEIAFNL